MAPAAAREASVAGAKLSRANFISIRHCSPPQSSTRHARQEHNDDKQKKNNATPEVHQQPEQSVDHNRAR
jgi:hypothetical protein